MWGSGSEGQTGLLWLQGVPVLALLETKSICRHLLLTAGFGSLALGK